jgi:general secretion pathway protein G
MNIDLRFSTQFPVVGQAKRLLGRLASGLAMTGSAPADRRHRERGFTLLELLVVLAILGLLIGLVAPAAIRQLGSAKHKVADQAIGRLVGILDIYRLDVGSYPTTEQGLQALVTRPSAAPGWNGPYVKAADALVDPWGRAYEYRSPSQRPAHDYDLFSLGSDGKAGGEGEAADLINP